MDKKIVVVTNKLDNQGNPTNGVKVYNTFCQMGYETTLMGHLDRSDNIYREADLILLFGTALYDENLYQIEGIRKLLKPGASMALWYFDACNPDFNHSKHKFDNLSKITQYLDWLFMTDHSYPYEKLIKNYHHLPQGIYKSDFEKEPEWDKERQFDVIFTGDYTGEFLERGKQLELISSKYAVDIYGRHSPRRVYGNDFWNAYQNAKVAYVPAPPQTVRNQYWSNRIYLAAATGTPCIVGWVNGIEKHFRGVEEVIYFQSDQDILDSIEYLIGNKEKAIEIGMAARERVMRDHTYENRIAEMMGIIEKGGKSWQY